jgi:hypothetical protein
VDIERFYRIIDRHLFDSIYAFLDQKGVDTSEVKLQMQLIVNGIINNGTVLAGTMVGVANQQINNGAGAANASFPSGAPTGAPAATGK